MTKTKLSHVVNIRSKPMVKCHYPCCVLLCSHIFVFCKKSKISVMGEKITRSQLLGKSTHLNDRRKVWRKANEKSTCIHLLKHRLRVWHANKDRSLLRTPGPFPFRTWICSTWCSTCWDQFCFQVCSLSGRGGMVKLFTCGARGPVFEYRSSHFDFRDLVSPAP